MKRNAFQFRRANEEDLPEICRIVKLAGESVPVKEWFEAEDEEFLAKHIREEGFTLLAKKNGRRKRSGSTIYESYTLCRIGTGNAAYSWISATKKRNGCQSPSR